MFIIFCYHCILLLFSLLYISLILFNVHSTLSLERNNYLPSLKYLFKNNKNFLRSYCLIEMYCFLFIVDGYYHFYVYRTIVIYIFYQTSDADILYFKKLN